MNNSYSYKKVVMTPFKEAVTKVKKELAKEGFGVLTEINVTETLKKKLNVDYEDYLIIGACNPPSAYQALTAEQDIGLLLPCNVIVYQQEDKTYVSAVLPTAAMAMVQNQKIAVIAQHIEEKLKKVIDNT